MMPIRLASSSGMLTSDKKLAAMIPRQAEKKPYPAVAIENTSSGKLTATAGEAIPGASAEWVATNATSVVLSDGSIILMDDRKVWRSTDHGATWTEAIAIAEYSNRSNSTSVVLPDNSIVLIGGSNLHDVWRLETNISSTHTICLPLIIKSVP
jgi:hypothetical protein